MALIIISLLAFVAIVGMTAASVPIIVPIAIGGAAAILVAAMAIQAAIVYIR